MNWHGASQFWAMGGYAPYVWGSYGITALLMLLEPWLAGRRRRRALHAVASQQEEQESRP